MYLSPTLSRLGDCEERVGGTRTIPVNVRLVAATNRDLAKMVAAGQFRSDLYYRLRVFPVTLPPLRERREDIPLLVGYFLSSHSKRMGKRIETIPPETMQALVNCDEETRNSAPGLHLVPRRHFVLSPK